MVLGFETQLHDILQHLTGYQNGSTDNTDNTNLRPLDGERERRALGGIPGEYGA